MENYCDYKISGERPLMAQSSPSGLTLDCLVQAQSRPSYQSVVLPFDSLICLVRFGREAVVYLNQL
jgi:hypothetical protein